MLLFAVVPKKLDYFSSVSVNHDSGVLRNTDDFSYKNNLNIMRYVFQNNFNLNLSKSSKLSLNLNVQLRDYSGPTSNTSDLFGMVMESNPVDFPVRFPDDPNVSYIRWVENPVVNIIVASVIHTLKWQEDISHNLKVQLWPT